MSVIYASQHLVGELAPEQIEVSIHAHDVYVQVKDGDRVALVLHGPHVRALVAALDSFEAAQAAPALEAAV